MEKKKINDISEIWDGKKLKFKDFSNLDLSGIDLSEIPESAWNNCIFFNTDFSNTNIKFRPNKLATSIADNYFEKNRKGIYMLNCIFDNSDLSYLTPSDFYSPEKKCVVFYDGCSFKKTGFHISNYLVNMVLDDYYLKKDFNDFDEFISRNNYIIIDINTIVKNPLLKVPSYLILRSIASYLYHVKEIELPLKKTFDGYLKRDEMTIQRKKELVKECEGFLEYDKQGYLKKLYEMLKPMMNLTQRYNFFTRKIDGVHIKNVNIKNFPISLLYMFEFSRNNFDNVLVDNGLYDLLLPDGYFLYDFGILKNTYTKLLLPGIKYDSWQENKYGGRRIANGVISFLTKVYVELSRDCNGKCEFCRNSSFGKCKYDFEKIKETLNNIKTYINIVVIGGGEPTLRLDDAKKLRMFFEEKKENLDFHMFTNGSNPDIINDDYVMEKFKINLSRHAKDDIKNAKIFGISPINLMNVKDIEKMASKNPEMTLSATCFNGGMDNLDDIILYIEFAKEIGVKKVLLTDLHKDMSMGNNEVYDQCLNINPNIFNEVINYLKEKGFKDKYPIYATGGYVSYVFKDQDDFSVTIQSYITKKELDDHWIEAIKRTFDLSIDPAGNLYENWHQQSSPVKSIGSKKI